MDFLDPLELCPNDRTQGEQVKIAVHALMLNPNCMYARFKLLQYVFGDDALNYTGKYPVYQAIREQDKELFEFANQVKMAFCCYKLAQSIHTYDRYQHSLESFIWLTYDFAKMTVYGYAKKAYEEFKKHRPYKPDTGCGSNPFPILDTTYTLNHHIGTQWAEVAFSALCKHANVYGAPVKVMRRKQVGGEITEVTASDGSRHQVKVGYHLEPLQYIMYDMSPEECERALDVLIQHGAPLYRDPEAKRYPHLSKPEFEHFKRFYTENSKDNTTKRRVNNLVNLEIGRLYLCEGASLAEILDAVGPDYPEQVAGQLSERTDQTKPAPLTPITIRSRVYQNLVPMWKEFMKEREGCITGEELASPPGAKEGSSVCNI